MNILIITPFYKHDKNIASVRWTNIGARLAKKHNVIIVTQPHDDMDMNVTVEKDENGILVARINQKTDYEKLAVKHFGGATGDDWQTSSAKGNDAPTADDWKRKLKNKLLFASMKKKAKQYAAYIERHVIPKDTKIDVVISSACPFIEMLFGYETKRRLKCKWISDFRDLPFTEDVDDCSHRMKPTMKRCLAHADAVVTIANKGKEVLVREAVDKPEKIHVIRNGFSLSDAREISNVNDGKLHIVHTGSMYGGNRKPEFLFRAVSLAKKENSDLKCVLECAGGNNSNFINSTENSDLEVIDRGFVPRETALDMQSKADILLGIVINRPGTLIAKYYEYILNKKPIISITCGNSQEKSEETDFITELNLGIAIEESEGEKAIERLAKYLLLQWDLKSSGKPLLYEPDDQKTSQFNLDIIAEKIEKLCLSL